MSEPAPPSSPSDAPVFDNARLIALVRQGDQQAIDLAYQITFRNEMGRLVLAHHLMDCGVGSAIPISEAPGDLIYRVARHNAALDLAAKAGLDQATIVVAALTGTVLEENPHATAEQEPPADVAAFEPEPGDGF